MKFSVLFLLVALLSGCSSTHQSSTNVLSQRTIPGLLTPTKALLPNGAIVSPAGTSIDVGFFPTNIVFSPDRRNAVVLNSGFGQQTLSILNIAQKKVVQTLNIKKCFYGAAWSALGDYFFVAGGNDNTVYRYGFHNDSAWFLSSIKLGKPAPEEFISPVGIAINQEGSQIYAVSRMNNTVFKLNAYDNTIIDSVQLDTPLYGCVLDEKRNLLYVSEWGKRAVAVIDILMMQKKLSIPVGDHPSELLMNRDRSLLFVTNSNENTVSKISLATMQEVERIDVGILPQTYVGSTPNSLALSENENLLFVANADNNALAVVNIAQQEKSIVKGFIPTGWYPTVVRCVDSLLIVANGKGLFSKPNPHNENIGELLQGTVSFIPLPNDETLKLYTQTVKENLPFTNKKHFADWDSLNPLPKSSSQSSPIRYIFLIVKEGRTYDDILGDLAKTNGDSALAKYGYAITPNHHALANEFTVLDNFYSNGEVSANGLQWLLAGYATDYVEKTWQTLYSRRGGFYDYEQDGIAYPFSGYVWDALIQKNIRLRNYGMFLDEEALMERKVVPLNKALAPYTSFDYYGINENYFDTSRAAVWEKEFACYVSGDSLPQFQLIRLPNDHTMGVRLGAKTPRAMLADNDIALGSIVEKISQSKYWKESAIFIVESNPYGGADHVDAFRVPAIIVSPYAKRNFIDHTMYSSTSLLRTIELLLNISPLTQHDAGATPLYRSFSALPDTTQFHKRIPNINLLETR